MLIFCAERRFLMACSSLQSAIAQLCLLYKLSAHQELSIGTTFGVGRNFVKNTVYSMDAI